LGHDQIVLDTLNHKDTYGSDRFLPFEHLFDVEHWNSWYPHVPRLVHCRFHPLVTGFQNYWCEHALWKCNGQIDECQDPFAIGKESTPLFTNYLRYARGKGPLAITTNESEARGDKNNRSRRNPVETAILKGALRPHPRILEWTKKQQQHFWQQNHHRPGTRTDVKAVRYLTLHARVEPDMQHHPMCPELKVTNLTEIIDMLEQAFPGEQVPMICVPINRPILEAYAVIRRKNKKKPTNWLAIENLKTLNRITRNGLWKETVPVVELGSSSLLKESSFHATPSTIGAVFNFEIA